LKRRQEKTREDKKREKKRSLEEKRREKAVEEVRDQIGVFRQDARSGCLEIPPY
jgi:hypothetical protein